MQGDCDSEKDAFGAATCQIKWHGVPQSEAMVLLFWFYLALSQGLDGVMVKEDAFLCISLYNFLISHYSLFFSSGCSLT